MATPTDFLAQLRYLLKIGCRPDLIIVGVDENTLISFDRPNQVGILGHVGLFLEVPCPNNLRIIGRAVSLCGPSTTRDSLLRLLKPQPAKRNIAAVGDILLEDGYLVYCDKAREIQAGTFDLPKMLSGRNRRGETIRRIRRLQKDRLGSRAAAAI